MKRLILFAIICMLGMASFVEIAHCELPYPPDMTVVYIKFYHDGGNSSLDITKNGSTEVEVPEWYPGESNRDENMAYIKSQSNRKIKVKFWIDRTGIQNYGAYATATGSGNIGDVDEENFDFDGEQYSSDILMEFDGSVPGSVGKPNFSLYWYGVLPSEPEDIPYLIDLSGPHDYYTLLATPQAPMAEPWTEVLEYSCDWASGESDADDAAIEIGKHIYEDFGLKYDVVDAAPHYQGEDQGVIQFELTDFLNDVPGSSLLVDCEDTAEALTTFANVLGCGMVCKGSAAFGQVNCINLIGVGWTNNPRYLNGAYCSDKIYDENSVGTRSYFGQHVFGVLDSKIYDCMIRVDTDANPDAEPHSPSNGTWALGNWTWSTYKDSVVHSGTPGTPIVRSFDVR